MSAHSRYNIQTAGTVDFNKIKIDAIKTNKYGGRSARISYDGGRFLIQTPRLRLPYGMGVFEEKDAEGRVTKMIYSLDFSFGGYKADERNQEKPLVKRFYSFMTKFENFVKEQAKKNSYSWIGEPDAEDATIRALFRPLIKYARDKTTGKITDMYPPTFKAKVGFWDGRFTMDVFDQSHNLVEDPRTALTKGAEALSIISVDSITFAGGKFGVKFTAQQVKSFLPDTLRGTYAFNDEEDDEYDADAAVSTTQATEEPKQASTFIEEDEEEAEAEEEEEEEEEDDLEDELEDELDEEESEPEPEPEPKPEPKKTTKKTTKKSTATKKPAAKRGGRSKKST